MPQQINTHNSKKDKESWRKNKKIQISSGGGVYFVEVSVKAHLKQRWATWNLGSAVTSKWTLVQFTYSVNANGLSRTSKKMQHYIIGMWQSMSKEHKAWQLPASVFFSIFACRWWASAGFSTNTRGYQKMSLPFEPFPAFWWKKCTNMHYSKMKRLIPVSLESNIWVLLSWVYFVYVLNVDCVERFPPIPSS